MLIITGQTFAYRDTLKAMQARWNGDYKRWEIDRPTTRNREILRGLVGCIVNETVPETKPVRETKPDTLAELINALVDRTTEYINTERKSNIYGDSEQYFNYFAPKYPLAFFGFSSLFKFVEYVESVPVNDAANEAWSQAKREFTGTADMREAIDLARNGWNEILDDVAEIMEVLNTEHAIKRQREYGVTGGTVSVGRLLAGNPIHMRRREKLPGRRVVTLFVELSMKGIISAESMKLRAIVVAAMCDLIEQRGYSCGIVAVDTSLYGKNVAYQLAVQIKEAGQKLNVSDVAFALGHPSFLRRFSFATVCSVPELRDIWKSQGMVAPAFNAEHTPERNEFYIKGLNKNSDDVFQILRWIKPDGLPIEMRERHANSDD